MKYTEGRRVIFTISGFAFVGLSIWLMVVGSRNIHQGCTEYICNYQHLSEYSIQSETSNPCTLTLYPFSEDCLLNHISSNINETQPMCGDRIVSCPVMSSSFPEGGCSIIGNSRCTFQDIDGLLWNSDCPLTPPLGPCYHQGYAVLISLSILFTIGFTYLTCYAFCIDHTSISQ